MEHVDARRALELLTDVVNAHGYEFEYGPFDAGDSGPPDCRYEIDGAPSCLVGHVLFRAGVGVDTLAHLDTVGVDANNLASEGLDVDKDACVLLHKAQRNQDNGTKWGDVLEIVRKSYEEKAE